MQTKGWQVFSSLGAWHNFLYIMTPSEWEAGKTSEIMLNQLGFNVEIVEVIPYPDLDLHPLLQLSETPERSCIMCGKTLDYNHLSIDSKILVENKSFFLYGKSFRRFGELRKVICPSCNYPETWKRYFGYIPVDWFDEKDGRVLSFVGKTLRNHEEVNNHDGNNACCGRRTCR
ncbi:hypothetical protein [Desulfitobacterium sp. AusDCA]|uniref:hypothetical protein n=1 Tax=Desulfitobacterium sp. AusDCA TaxID=3240383 RepID=UPI003DA6E1EF